MAKTDILSSTGGFNKRDALNSKNGIALQDFEGDSMVIPNVVKAACATNVDEDTGELKNVSILVTEDQTYFTSISSTIFENMDDLMDILEDEKKIDVRINRRVSKGNKRDFLTLTVL